MKKKCKVVMLATEKAENALIVNTEGNKSMWGYKMEYLKNVPAKPYHLYITSDDEIKDGDYCMSIDINSKLHKPFKCVNKEAFINPEFLNSVDAKDVKKIIATTDTSLTPLFCKTQTKNIP